MSSRTHNGDATVKIKDKAGKVQTVRISGGDGRSFSCPERVQPALDRYVIRAGRVKLTLVKVRRTERVLLRRYPNGAPRRVVAHYKALQRRDDRLVDAFNAQVDAHNAILRQDCAPAD